MKAFSFSTRIIFFWLFLFPAAMAEEENQEKELLHGQNDQTMPQQGLVSDGVDGRADSRPFAVNAGPKRVWPEVVGLTVEEAEKKIKEDMPMAQFQVVPPGCFVTMDFISRRVRLFVDSSNKVARPPRIG